MPKRKERMASYIRESDPYMTDETTTMESQVKLIRDYAAREGYLYDPELEFAKHLMSWLSQKSAQSAGSKSKF